MAGSPFDDMIARLQGNLALLERMRERLDPEQIERMRSLFERQIRDLQARQGRRRRGDDGSMPALVEPPRGPKPFAGGAAAALEFD